MFFHPKNPRFADPSFVIDLTPQGGLYALMAQDPSACLDWLNTVQMRGAMSAGLRTIIQNQIAGFPDPADKLRTAVYLVITSSEFTTFD